VIRPVRAVSFVLGVALLIAATDQVLKWLVTIAMPSDASRALIPGVLALTYRQNTGTAFGLLHQISLPALLLVQVVVLAIFLTLAWRFLVTWTGGIATGLVLGGAAGNVADRLRVGHVIDYLDVRVWPVFNFADACVVIGIALLLLVMLRHDRALNRTVERPTA
jgi:signal peptidase II